MLGGYAMKSFEELRDELVQARREAFEAEGSGNAADGQRLRHTVIPTLEREVKRASNRAFAVYSDRRGGPVDAD